jgi:hypothetical protein
MYVCMYVISRLVQDIPAFHPPRSPREWTLCGLVIYQPALYFRGVCQKETIPHMYLTIMHLTIGKCNNYKGTSLIMILLEPPSFATMFSQVFHPFFLFFFFGASSTRNFRKLCVLSYQQALRK